MPEVHSHYRAGALTTILFFLTLRGVAERAFGDGLLAFEAVSWKTVTSDRSGMAPVCCLLQEVSCLPASTDQRRVIGIVIVHRERDDFRKRPVAITYDDLLTSAHFFQVLRETVAKVCVGAAHVFQHGYDSHTR